MKKFIAQTLVAAAVVVGGASLATGEARAAETCSEYAPYSLSTGMMVGEKYTTAAVCLQQKVSPRKVLVLDGYSMDEPGDDVCTVAIFKYTRGRDARAFTIKQAPNCGGKMVFAKRSINNLTTATMSLCLYNRTDGSERCVNSNQFYPEPKRRTGPFGPR